MSAICIGPCCIPYSAIFPLFMVALKWILDKLRMMGIKIPFLTKSSAPVAKGSCCSADGTCSMPATSACNTETAKTATPSSVSKSDRLSPKVNFVPIESMEEWEDLVKKSASNGSKIVVDFTASWCGPCKKIAPFYEALSANYDATFIKVDVDELDELAEYAKVSMMPTFAIYQGSNQLEKMSGANESKLEAMVANHAAKFT
ncbi:hypothetical protein TrLO_g8487 [Triparma laevis f. longispina]|uniref:Thioredoxin domain-containing protein n=1 Tax=Triparma laevis f. longispina TaxID=1714387 RepID=A0A9W7C9L1_9STRA|nr:hypothetical protein TrLO_g8487 [Triparma laevis f. longispina]